MGLIMRLKDTCVGSTKDMESAFQNILNEIIEHAIEGICFEAHRAVKLGYFPDKEYVLKEREFDFYEELPELAGDIFANGNKVVFAACPKCNQKKAANTLARHIMICRSKPNENLTWDNSGKTENGENNVDGNNSDGKKGNDARKQAKSTPNYDTMSPEEIQDFLLKHCGVISRRTGKPCSNSLNCNIHSKEDRDNVRSFIFESLAVHLADGNIDIDTVD